MEVKVDILLQDDKYGPTYATDGSAGMDLRARVDNPLGIKVAPTQRVLVPTGVSISLPKGYEAQIRPRSGLAWKAGISVLNSPGTVDSDYRGEIMVNIINLGYDTFTIQDGDRIAQMVIAPYSRAVLSKVESLDETDRGEGGHGSTGVK